MTADIDIARCAEYASTLADKFVAGERLIVDSNQEITGLLIQWNDGSAEALEKLMPLVEAELRRMAANHMRHESPGHTLQTTALVNEAYLKLIDQRRVRWQNRAHFYALASTLMRRILLNHARANQRQKRGGNAVQVDLETVAIVIPERPEELIALDEALTRLASFDERKGKVVEMRFFGGLTEDEVAEVLLVSVATVRNDWRLAKAWLQRAMLPQATGTGADSSSSTS